MLYKDTYLKGDHMKFLKEFKEFISKGNIFDLAVAFIIGGAFKALISSLVKNVIMPALSIVLGEEGFDNYKYVITEASDIDGIVENAIYWGMFLQDIVDFIIIAFVIFTIVYVFNRLQERRKKPEEVVEKVIEEVKPTVEDLLTDIKLLLEKK